MDTGLSDFNSSSSSYEEQPGESDRTCRRLATFGQRWTGAKDRTLLARAGFLYTGVSDKTECTGCGLKLLNWMSTDDALKEHFTRRPLCPFITAKYKPINTMPAKHPKFQSLQSRLESYNGWPRRHVPKTPEELAAAGFFYIGSADRVTCFQCGITLRDWEAEHDPVSEHQRYSKDCPFINKTDMEALGVKIKTPDVEHRNTDPRSQQGRLFSTLNGACPLESSSLGKGPFNASEVKVNDTAYQAASTAASTTSACPSAATANGQHSEYQYTSLAQPAALEASTSLESTNASKAKQIMLENRRLREKSTCRVCKVKVVGVLFLPCGHLVTCSECAPKVNNCVLCDKTVVGTVKTYFT